MDQVNSHRLQSSGVKSIVVASHNAGKVREINELIAPFGLQAKSAAELGLDEPVEDCDTFEANALTKANSRHFLLAEVLHNG